MNGYIIVGLNEETGEPEKFWNGIVFESTIEQSQFLTDKVAARKAVGDIQSKNSNLEVKLVPASLAIALGHVADTSSNA